ncbi:hypothetical protein M427DRAFT_70376 [Gonapodya prolifera JEL478]|uniref:Uncharacterized protein n=1 Tax=Gonapodya prolifera (strain JEL478) TaxID=1344416 RepID=A0A139ADZ8_GONPJ|nr:hypothetical protein M427DRAFT_70376 [Gonapodya prolifera JEL478]|eukprot:KXS14814.1 hypothetical protein M427DRAFT_70376 [Gonapodya prolifera JEL478]
MSFVPLALAGSLFSTLSRGGVNSAFSAFTFAPIILVIAAMYFLPTSNLIDLVADPTTDVRYLWSIAAGLFLGLLLLLSFIFSRLPLFYPDVEVRFPHQVVANVSAGADGESNEQNGDSKGQKSSSSTSVDWLTVTEDEFKKIAPGVDCLRAEVWSSKDGQPVILPSSHPFSPYINTIELSPSSSRTSKPQSGTKTRNRKPAPPSPQSDTTSPHPPVPQPPSLLTLKSLLTRFRTLPVILDLHTDDDLCLKTVVDVVRKERFPHAKPVQAAAAPATAVVPQNGSTNGAAPPAPPPKAHASLAWGSTTHASVSASLTRLNHLAQLADIAERASAPSPSSRSKTARSKSASTSTGKDDLTALQSHERFALVPTILSHSRLSSLLRAYWLWLLPFTRIPESLVVVPDTFPTSSDTPSGVRGLGLPDFAALFGRLAARGIAVVTYSPVYGRLERLEGDAGADGGEAALSTAPVTAFVGLEAARKAGANGVCVDRWESAAAYVDKVVQASAAAAVVPGNQAGGAVAPR